MSRTIQAFQGRFLKKQTKKTSFLNLIFLVGLIIFLVVFLHFSEGINLPGTGVIYLFFNLITNLMLSI